MDIFEVTIDEATIELTTSGQWVAVFEAGIMANEAMANAINALPGDTIPSRTRRMMAVSLFERLGDLILPTLGIVQDEPLLEADKKHLKGLYERGGLPAVLNELLNYASDWPNDAEQEAARDSHQLALIGHSTDIDSL